MIHPVATIGTAPSPNRELPSQAVPVGGIDVEQLDLSTRQAAAYLFPRERGLLLLELLFLQAEVQQLQVDGAGQVDVAIIHLQSIEVFARTHPGWSKDTTLRYIAVLEALQILQRRRRGDGTDIHIPLTPWSPSEAALAALDALLVEEAAREKLQQLASGVKARFLLLYGSPNSWPSLFDDLHGTLTDVEEILANRPSRQKRQLLQLRVTNLKARLATAAQKGDFSCGKCHHQEQHLAQKGDFYPEEGTSQRQYSAQKGDFHPTSQSSQTLRSAQKGDFYPEEGTSQRQYSAQKGDFHPTSQSSQTLRSAQKGDFQSALPSDMTQKGDFQGQSGSIATRKGDFQGDGPAASLNDNVITLLTNSLEEDYVSDNDAAISVHVQEPYSPNVAAKVGRQLALFLENSPSNTGGFVAKCKVCTPTVIQGAVIDMLVHQAFPTVDPADDRGRPRNKAKWFHNFCNKYSMPGARIPAFITKWLKTDLYWQDLETYWKETAEQLDEAGARYRRYMIADAGSADLVRQWLRGEIEQQALDEALQSSVLSQQQPQSVSQPVTSAPSAANGTSFAVVHAEKAWMDEDEAEILAEEILRDAGPLGVSRAVAKQEHGVYVVALVWRGAPMTMKTPQQWRTHLQNVRPLFEKMQREGKSNGAAK